MPLGFSIVGDARSFHSIPFGVMYDGAGPAIRKLKLELPDGEGGEIGGVGGVGPIVGGLAALKVPGDDITVYGSLTSGRGQAMNDGLPGMNRSSSRIMVPSTGGGRRCRIRCGL